MAECELSFSAPHRVRSLVLPRPRGAENLTPAGPDSAKDPILFPAETKNLGCSSLPQRRCSKS